MTLLILRRKETPFMKQLNTIKCNIISVLEFPRYLEEKKKVMNLGCSKKKKKPG